MRIEPIQSALPELNRLNSQEKSSLTFAELQLHKEDEKQPVPASSETRGSMRDDVAPDVVRRRNEWPTRKRRVVVEVVDEETGEFVSQFSSDDELSNDGEQVEEQESEPSAAAEASIDLRT